MGFSSLVISGNHLAFLVSWGHQEQSRAREKKGEREEEKRREEKKKKKKKTEKDDVAD